MKVKLYSTKSKTIGSFSLPKEFGGEINLSLIAQAVRVYRDRVHPGNSKVLTRAEVSLTKAKWFRQKGTGRARHGAQSAPIFVGGGVAHGPKGVKRVLGLPKKMRQKALASAFSLKAKDGSVLTVKDLRALEKTKDAGLLIDRIRDTKGGRITFAVSDKNRNLSLLVRNIKNVSVERFSSLNAYKVYLAGTLVLDVDVFAKEKAK